MTATTTKFGNETSPPGTAPRMNDALEAADLEQALDALDVSEHDDPTREETHQLRRAVVHASVALDDKQARIAAEPEEPGPS